MPMNALYIKGICLELSPVVIRRFSLGIPSFSEKLFYLSLTQDSIYWYNMQSSNFLKCLYPFQRKYTFLTVRGGEEHLYSKIF